ncbi:MAG: hypothetical protein M1826_000394 [Phylliscum demangeonii]|nr:MAG: hypothetical protein M1826_000394 [Phylliscum demangeonii]
MPGMALVGSCLWSILAWSIWFQVQVGASPPRLVAGASPEELGAVKSRAGCPDYKHYSAYPHFPFSDGPLRLPFQRPSPACRTFTSVAVEKVIEEMTRRMTDKDLARLFENAFPNTLDTTVRWHVDGTETTAKRPAAEQKRQGTHRLGARDRGQWDGAQSFIVTGDINAEWLRDSSSQLAVYHALSAHDSAIKQLILGAINTQAEFVIESPYCNAFQAPLASRQPAAGNGQQDAVHPAYEPSVVFECKWELDSLASFLALGNAFYAATQSTAFLTPRWYTALGTVLRVLDAQSQPTFEAETGRFEAANEYTFRRHTDVGTETLNLAGVGNPINNGTGLVRSAFRPSDDATILPFFIPANAMISVELQRAALAVRAAGGKPRLARTLQLRGEQLAQAVWAHGTREHPRWGRVFAYEVDGYGSAILMDDANLPSLLALPLLGFVDVSNDTYQNTRRMVLAKQGNPYYLQGRAFRGIGGPHIGLQNAWPMSLLVQAMTSTDDAEIMDSITLVRNASRLGLVHESINVDYFLDYTRSWFAWANSVFAQTILDLARRKPHLLFGEGAAPFVVGGEDKGG